jgi:hypothetical protein
LLQLIRGGSAAAAATDIAKQPIGQSTAAVLLVMVIGIAGYLWYMRYLRSRAALIFVALIVGTLAYFAIWTNPITAP